MMRLATSSLERCQAETNVLPDIPEDPSQRDAVALITGVVEAIEANAARLRTVLAQFDNAPNKDKDK
jgi:hypothetical protein